MKQKREKKWWQHLLVIPVMLALNVLVLAAAGVADTAQTVDGVGHAVPAYLMAAAILCGVLTVVLTVRALVLCVRAVLPPRKGTEETAGKSIRKPVWHCFIPLMVEVPLAVAAVGISGYWEITSFYNAPNHVGFAIPAGTFLLAGIFFLSTVVLGLFCAIAAAVRSRRNRKAG